MGILPVLLVAFTRRGALGVLLPAIVLLGFHLVGHRVIPTPGGPPGG